MKNKTCHNCKNWIKNKCFISAMRDCFYSLNVIACGLDIKKLSKKYWGSRPQKQRKVAKRATNKQMDAIILLGKWHRAYKESRDALEKVDDETVKYMASVA